MAPTPYPQNLYHTGAARPLSLDIALNVPPTGDIVLSVGGNAAAKGWPAIPGGQKMVVTVGRGTQYETKYLVSSISSGQTSSMLTVLAADRNYDGLVPQNAPAGTVVEHTVSATEMSTINNHMRTKAAHGSDGNLVDENSTQTLTNKTLTNPVLSNPQFGAFRLVPVGGIIMWPSDVIPSGFLKCDGQAITAVAYPELVLALGGALNVPNLTDRFVKGGPVNLTAQRSHTRTLDITNMPAHKHDVAVSASQNPHSHGGGTGWVGNHNHGGGTGGASPEPLGLQAWDQQNYYQGNGGHTAVRAITQRGGAHVHGIGLDGTHNHTIPADTPAISTSVTESTKGSGSPFNIEPQHVVLQYIICAKPQGV